MTAEPEQPEQIETEEQEDPDLEELLEGISSDLIAKELERRDDDSLTCPSCQFLEDNPLSDASPDQLLEELQSRSGAQHDQIRASLFLDLDQVVRDHVRLTLPPDLAEQVVIWMDQHSQTVTRDALVKWRRMCGLAEEA